MTYIRIRSILIYQAYVQQMSIDLLKENCFTFKKDKKPAISR